MNLRIPHVVRFAGIAACCLLVSCEAPPLESHQIGYRGVAMEQNYHPATYKKLQDKNVAPAVIPSMGSSGPLAVSTYKNVKVLTDLTVPEMTRIMLAMTAWIAPPDKSCSYCHAADMASDEIYQKVVARRMLQMVRNINTNWGAHVAGTGVTCYTCHRGQAVPTKVWYLNPAEKDLPLIGDRALQNSPAPTVGFASLPYDPYPSFLLAGHDIKIGATTALPTGDRQSIKQTEWTYGLMMNISGALGVNCTFCHNSRSFRDWDQSTPQRAKAWHAIRMVRQLNNDYLTPLAATFPPERLGPLGDTAKVNCATCHQGVNKPMFGRGGAADYPELREKPHAEATHASLAAAPTGVGAP